MTRISGIFAASMSVLNNDLSLNVSKGPKDISIKTNNVANNE